MPYTNRRNKILLFNNIKNSLMLDLLAANYNPSTGVWSDSSGNNRNAIQATSNNRPTLETNILNGYPAVRFDGINDSLSIPATFSQPLSIFIVGKQNSKATAARFIDSISPRALFGLTTSGYIQMFAPGTGNNLLGNIDNSGQYKIFNAEFNRSGSTGRVDNINQIAGNPGIDGFGTLLIGRDSASSVGAFLNGDIVHIRIYNQIFTAIENNQIYLELKNIYNL